LWLLWKKTNDQAGQTQSNANFNLIFLIGQQLLGLILRVDPAKEL